MKKVYATLALVVLLVSACGQTPEPTSDVPESLLAPQVFGSSRVVAWGYNRNGQLDIPTPPLGTRYTAVAGGSSHSLALRSDGHVIQTGDLPSQVSAPALPVGRKYEAVAAGIHHSLALRSDGVVVAWGDDSYGQLQVPALPTGLRYTAIAAKAYHTLALRSDGRVVAWGNNDYGQTVVPALPTGLIYKAIGAGYGHSLAVRSDGRVVAWGDNDHGQSDVPPLPTGLTYRAVAGGANHSLALRSDGRVVAWGFNDDGQTNVPALPANLTYKAVDAGFYHNLALRSDGRIIAWGYNQDGVTDVPALPNGYTYTAMRAGNFHNLAIASYTPSIIPPTPVAQYSVHFEGLTSGTPVASVAVGRGVTYGGAGKVNTNPIQIEGRTAGSKQNRAIVFGKTAAKVLTVVGDDGKTPSASGGTLAVSFVPSFNSRGVTVGTLDLIGALPAGATLTVYPVAGEPRTVVIPGLVVGSKQPRTVALGDAGVRAVGVTASTAFALDNIVFGE